MSIQATLFLLATVIAIVHGQNWTQLRGAAKQISAKGSNVWSLTKSGQPMNWVESKWKYFPGRLTQIAAYPAGAMGLREYEGQNNVYYTLNNNFNNQWVGVPYAHFVDVLPGKLIIVDLSGNVWIWTSTAGWSILDSNQSAEQVVLGIDNQIWKLDVNGDIQHYSGSGSNWDQPMATDTAMGNVKHISAHNASRFMATDTNNNAWLWNGSVWSQLSGHACAQAAIGDTAVYCVDPNYAIWSLTI